MAEAVAARLSMSCRGAEAAAEHAVKLTPVGSRAGHLLAVDVPSAASGSAKLAPAGSQESARRSRRGYSR